MWRRRQTRTKGPLCKCGVCVLAVMFSWRIGGVCRAKCNSTYMQKGLLMNKYKCGWEKEEKKQIALFESHRAAVLDWHACVWGVYIECTCYGEWI